MINESRRGKPREGIEYADAIFCPARPEDRFDEVFVDMQRQYTLEKKAAPAAQKCKPQDLSAGKYEFSGG